MFKKKITDKVFPGDFNVTYLGKEGNYVNVRVGPKFHQWVGPSNMNTPSRVSQIDLINFYTHYTSSFAWSFALALKEQGKNLSELSRYLPVTEPDKSLAKVKEFIFTSEASGGTFRIPFGIKTYFWIKVPSIPSSRTTELETGWVRMEYGAAVPTNPGTKFDGQGKASYNTFIPIFSVSPDESGLNYEEYEMGELRYYDPEYSVVQNGVSRDVIFPYGKLSTIPTA